MRKNTAGLWISRILLVAVYTVFFAVHFFYVAMLPSPYPVKGIKSEASVSRKSCVKVLPAKKAIVKLNKRFHLDNAQPASFVFIEPLITTYGDGVVSKPASHRLISLVISQGLRGPPVVVV
jgi:hypothetical protein